MIAEYLEPVTVPEAVAMVAGGEESRFLAGGQSLLVLVRQRLVQPSRLVSLGRIPELATTELRDGWTRLGSMVTYRQALETASPPAPPALVDACAAVGPIPVQNAGTLGGSLCHNAPGADVPTALLALDAVVDARTRAGDRRIPLSDFFTGYFETVLEDGELLTSILVPTPGGGHRSAYLKFNYRRVDMALVGVGVAFQMESGRARKVRIALGGVDAAPFRPLAAEARLENSELRPADLAEAGRLAASDRPLISDLHASADYRSRILPVLIRRAFERALASA